MKADDLRDIESAAAKITVKACRIGKRWSVGGKIEIRINECLNWGGFTLHTPSRADNLSKKDFRLLIDNGLRLEVCGKKLTMDQKMRHFHTPQ